MEEVEVIPNKPINQSVSVMDINVPTFVSPESDSDSGEDDDEYYQKFQQFEKKELLLNFHPEISQLNFKDVDAMTSIVRDAENNIIDPLHKTIPILTRYERARVLGVRAKQLENDAQPLIDVPVNMIDSYAIACEELKQRKIPFIIRRPYPDGASEYWKVEDLEIIEN